MQREEARLKAKHKAFLNTLQKRIQRDRDEQLVHRKNDSQTLIQRNKNVLIDILERHAIETKRTSDFLKYALSFRSRNPGEIALSLFNNNRAKAASAQKSKLPSLKQGSFEVDLDTSLPESIYSTDRKRKPDAVRLPRLINNKSLISENAEQTQFLEG